MSSELVVVPDDASVNLFGAAGPVEVLEAVKAIVGPLGAVIRENGMTVRIGSGEHTTIEGWQVLGAMLGVSAHTVWSRPLDVGGEGWEARAEARTKQGEVVGSAEAMVSREERNWRKSDEHALRSMAQTRAQSKALASALRFVMALTGASGTPAEEIGPQAAVPDWQLPVRDLKEVMHAAADVIGASVDHDVAMSRAQIMCRRIYEDCGNEIPTVVWQTLTLCLGAMVNTEPIEEAEGVDVAPPVSTPEPEVEPEAEEEAALEAAGMDVYGSLDQPENDTNDEEN